MINVSQRFRDAVIADSRRMFIKAVVDISDPDVSFTDVVSTSKAPFSVDAELHDKDTDFGQRYATLEHNRWLLDGNTEIYEDDYGAESQQGFASGAVADQNGEFSVAQSVELKFTGVDVLQAASVFFSNKAEDGHPVDFSISIMQGTTAVYTKSFTNFAATSASVDGFTVYEPTGLKITVSKWSDSRRVRIAEIIIGVYEQWTGDDLAGFQTAQRADLSMTSLPYGTVDLAIDNSARRFEPRAKESLFKSIEDRQGIDFKIGVDVGGSVEWVPAGRFYQYNGWKESDNGLTLRWNLVDIIGLLVDREYQAPETLPTTLGGWVQSVVLQLGSNFSSAYTVDAEYADYPLVIEDSDAISGIKCGTLLQYVCQASGTFARADKNGLLSVSPSWGQGNELTLDNMISYPSMGANEDLAFITFNINGTPFVVGGTNISSPKTITINNPFITTQEQALTAAKLIVAQYGGNKLTVTDRGNPSSEVGDVDTVELDEYSAMSARRIEQSFDFSSGVMTNCKSIMTQASGSFENRVLITENTTFTTPNNAQIFVVLGGGAQSGANGQSGSFDSAGADGVDGKSGKIWFGWVPAAGAQYSVTIGTHGAVGAFGTPTTFGTYSSDNGSIFSPSYTDINNGDAFGLTGAINPRENTSDGGAGGKGGKQGRRHKVQYSYTDGEGRSQTGERWVVDVYPTSGENGKTGSDGFALIYW